MEQVKTILRILLAGFGLFVAGLTMLFSREVTPFLFVGLGLAVVSIYLLLQKKWAWQIFFASYILAIVLGYILLSQVHVAIL